MPGRREVTACRDLVPPPEHEHEHVSAAGKYLLAFDGAALLLLELRRRACKSMHSRIRSTHGVARTSAQLFA